MSYRKRKKLTGESNYKCALKMHEIETSGKYDTKEIAIARMWFVDEMSPNAISDSGRVQSQRKQNMSSDMMKLRREA